MQHGYQYWFCSCPKHHRLRAWTGAAQDHGPDSHIVSQQRSIAVMEASGRPGGAAGSVTPSGAVASSAAACCLYGAHACARWAWRTWEFAVALILMQLYPQSLLLVSLYGLLDDLVRLLLGSYVGHYMDRCDRLQGASQSYALQNMCIGASASAAAALVWLKERAPGSLPPLVHRVLLGVSVVAGAFSSVGSMGAAMLVEREYPVVLCGGNTWALSRVNSVMRAIDLSCQMLSPVAAGFLMTYGGMLAACMVLGAYTLLVWLPERLLLQEAHRRAPALRQPRAGQPQGTTKAPHRLWVAVQGWSLYFQQSTWLAGLALALLYFTVLSLGFLMTSYLVWRGMSEATLSLFRAAGALSGLSATVLFPILERRLGLVVTGAGGICWQLICLLVGVIPVIVTHVMQQHHLNTLGAINGLGAQLVPSPAPPPPPPPTGPLGDRQQGPEGSATLYVMLSGLVASRCGLWLFDIAVTQVQQQTVADHDFGKVSGVQGSLQSGLEILSFVAGALLHQPQRFHWLMAGSCLVVATATALYLAFAAGPAGKAISSSEQAGYGAGVLHERLPTNAVEELELGREGVKQPGQPPDG